VAARRIEFSRALADSRRVGRDMAGLPRADVPTLARTLYCVNRGGGKPSGTGALSGAVICQSLSRLCGMRLSRSRGMGHCDLGPLAGTYVLKSGGALGAAGRSCRYVAI